MSLGNKEIISVIVPVHNSSSYVEGTLRTLLAVQDVTLEIVVVDDHSTDGTAEHCRKVLENSNAGLWQVLSSEGIGPADARNTGLAAARGDYLGFCDSDDTVQRNMYSVLLQTLKDNEADAAFCGYNVIRDGRILENTYTDFPPAVPDYMTGLEALDILGQRYFHAVGEEKSTILATTWRGLYRASFIEEHHIRFPEGMFLAEDMAFNLDVLKKASWIAITRHRLYNYLVRTDSISGTLGTAGPKRYLRMFHEMRKRFDVFESEYTGLAASGSLSGEAEDNHRPDWDAIFSSWCAGWAVNCAFKTHYSSLSSEEKNRIYRELENDKLVAEACRDQDCRHGILHGGIRRVRKNIVRRCLAKGMLTEKRFLF